MPIPKSLIDHAIEWDALSVKQRIVLLNRAMPGERWSDLRQRLASMEAWQMTTIQQEALGDIMHPVKNYGRRRTR